jgi:O-antigen/teichoic acid export membrane protein
MSTVTRLIGLTVSSAIGVVSTFVLAAGVARVLSVEEFGITRVATAYLVIVCMLGLFAVHDALASAVARAVRPEGVADLFASATALIVAASGIVVLVSMLLLLVVGYGSPALSRSLLLLTLVLPLLAVTQAYNGVLQAVGSYGGCMLTQIASGVVPLVVIWPASIMWSIDGWIGAKILSVVLLFVLSLALVMPYQRGGQVRLPVLRQLWQFSRLQIVSGLLSTALMTADVLLLERLTGNLAVVANYALGSLVPRASGFLPSAIGRAYFSRLGGLGSAGLSARFEFLVVNLVAGLGVGTVMAAAGPRLIALFFGSEYEVAGQVIVVWSAALVAMFHWQAVSIINVAVGKPARSISISFAGVLVGIPGLLLFIPQAGAVGAAWACALAYWAGALLGTWNLRADGLFAFRTVSAAR